MGAVADHAPHVQLLGRDLDAARIGIDDGHVVLLARQAFGDAETPWPAPQITTFMDDSPVGAD